MLSIATKTTKHRSSSSQQSFIRKMSVSAEQLGESKWANLPQGRIHYRSTGDPKGHPIIFVHGVLTNGDLWRNVVGDLKKDYHCIVPDMPLGSHKEPMNASADLSPTGLADILKGLVDSLDLKEAPTVVGNGILDRSLTTLITKTDTGGAITQVFVGKFPEVPSSVVLTSADAYESFPPPLLKTFPYMAYLPGSMWLTAKLFTYQFALRTLLTRRIHNYNLQRSRSLLDKGPPEQKIMNSFFNPILANNNGSEIARDTAKVAQNMSNKYTLDAAKTFGSFTKPVLIAWASEDRLFSPNLAKRLHNDFPNSSLEWISDSLTLVPEDQPKVLADMIRKFLEKNKKNKKSNL